MPPTALRAIVAAMLIACLVSGLQFRCRAPPVASAPRSLTRLMAQKKSSSGAAKLQRLDRVLSNRGVGSRNEVSKLLKQGRVSIDGEVVVAGADKYPADVRVEIDGEVSEGVPLLAVYHKPVGVHSVLADPWSRESLADLAGSWPFLKTMHPVGRLDADTSGLLLFSSNGHLTQLLLHPSTGIEREYEAVVVGTVDAQALTAKLAAGVVTTEGTFAAKLLEIHEGGTQIVDLKKLRIKFDRQEQRRARVSQAGRKDAKIDDDDNDDDDDDDDDDGRREGESDASDAGGSKLTEVPTTRLLLTVTEGKYRMVRRILHNAGHSVIALHRARYGGVSLAAAGRDCEEGEVDMCSDEEIEWALDVLERFPGKS